MSAEQTNAVTLFYCYAHEDEFFRQELEEHLASFKRQGYLVSWSDREITPGTEWRQEIETHLTSAHLILLFISPSFLYSDACDAEMRQALALGKAGRAWIIPILVRPVVWQQTPLAGLQLLPVDGKPISRWEDRDEAWQQVALHIGRIVSERLGFPFIPPEALPTTALKAQEPASLTHDLSFEPRNPYKGLYPFTEKDSGDFFGRESLIADLLEKLRATLSLGAPDAAPRLLSVFGPSGSGKSSVVLAGLLSALRRGELPGSEHWAYLKPISPGVRPLEALARTLSYHLSTLSLTSIEEDLKAPNARGLHKLADRLLQGEASMVVLYIDQFEELFTQTLEETERVQFIDLLVTAVIEPRGPLLVFLSLRADFYDRPMRFPDLFRLIEATRTAVLPLAHRDLRDIIKKPAALPDVRLQFEDDLMGELLADMYGQSGALPLLQFALERLFQKRQGRLLTVLAYEAMGRLQGALVQHAEATYALLPTEEYCVLTRLLFLRLVEPSAIGQDPIRRRMILGEFTFADPAREAMLEKIIDIFTTARLLTTSDQQEGAVVEVSHEALIRGWPRLDEWLREAYEDLSLQRRVREDSASWIRLGRPARRLYHDDQLKEALAWKQRSLLSHEEEQFLMASVNEEVQQRKRELVQRRRYQRRAVLIGLVLTTIATAATSGGIILFRGNQQLRGKQLFPTSTPAPRTLPYSYHGHTDVVESVAWSPDGKRLASASNDRTVQVWDASNDQKLLTYHGHLDVVNSVMWSPDGKRLASASNDQTVQIWDASSGRTLLTYSGQRGNMNNVVWSPDGKRLASANDEGTVHVRETSGEILLSYTGHSDAVYNVVWSPDGRRLASASADRTVRIWDASSGQMLLTYSGHGNSVYSVAWSPNGKLIASASEDQTARIWDASSGQTLLTYHDHADAVSCVAWSPNGRYLASASSDATVRVWNASSGRTLLTYRGHGEVVNSVVWSPDGKYLASASNDQTVQAWGASSGQTLLTYRGHTDIVGCVAWSPTGEFLASGSKDATVQVWAWLET